MKGHLWPWSTEDQKATNGILCSMCSLLSHIDEDDEIAYSTVRWKKLES